MSEPLLRFAGVTRRFGGVLALEDVTVEVPAGQICGLIGPNGAGKTTVFNVITNVFPPSSGEVVFEGRALGGLKPHMVVRRGIARTFQNIRLFETLTVDEHLRVVQRRDDQGRRARATQRDDLLEFAELSDVRGQTAMNLPYGLQRRVEIARALAGQPRLLLLDEPAAGMNPRESAHLSDFIREVRSRGVTILLIEHDMPFMMSLCDHLYVLNFGSLIADGPPAAIQQDPVVLEAYLGREEETAHADA